MSGNRIEINGVRIVDYLTYGRDQEFIVGLFLQTVPLFFALVPGSVPILRFPINGSIATGFLLCLLLCLLISLFNTIQWISNEVYSIELRKTKSQLISMLFYLVLGIVASSLGYLFFIFPYSHPEFGSIDAFLGVVCALLYAQVLAFVLWKRIQSESDSERIADEIETFLERTQQLRESPNSVPDGTTDELVSQARSLADDIEKEKATGTRNLSHRLCNWADDFENKTTIHGWKDILESDEFSTISNDLCRLS